MNSEIKESITRLKLPEHYKDTVTQYLSPIAEEIATSIATANKSNSSHSPFILGVQGSQGSGKSTCSEFIQLLLNKKHHLKTVVLSIDDFYLTRAERQNLATEVHPLLATRGVPGTHDIKLAINTVQQLMQLQAQQHITIPRFDKASDERKPAHLWTKVSGPIDVIIIEGWCVGLAAQKKEHLLTAINELETQEDPAGIWRNYVNNCLAGDYQTLFSMINKQLMLKAPSFDCVLQWRIKQEKKLIDALPEHTAGSTLRTLSNDQIKRFIAHYERLTIHSLTTLPSQADWCLILESDQRINRLQKPLEKK